MDAEKGKEGKVRLALVLMSALYAHSIHRQKALVLCLVRVKLSLRARVFRGTHERTHARNREHAERAWREHASERASERASDRQRASERQRGRDQYIYIERAHRCGDGLDDAAQASQPPEQPQHPQRTQRLRARSCGACVRVRARARARPCGVRVFAPVLRMPVSLAHARPHSERPSEEAKPFRTVRPSVRPSQETAWRRHVPERT